MHSALILVLLFSLVSGGSLKPASRTCPQIKTAQSDFLIHFEIINISGQAREAHIGHSVIPLPVAQRVALQTTEGNLVQIVSNTNQKIRQVINVSCSDEGHLFPVG
jgi:hypothetical protein